MPRGKKRLLQANVDATTGRRFDALARAAGHTNASYLRRLIIQHVSAIAPKLLKALDEAQPADGAEPALSHEVSYPLPQFTMNPGETRIARISPPGELGPFHPEWLTFPDGIAPHLGIQDVRVGKNSQFYTVAELPGSMFAKSASRESIYFETVGSGMEFSVYLVNVSARKISVSGIVYGRHGFADRPASRSTIIGLGRYGAKGGEEFTIISQPMTPFQPRVLFLNSRFLIPVRLEMDPIRRRVTDAHGLPVPHSEPKDEWKTANLLGAEPRNQKGQYHLAPPFTSMTPSDFLKLVVKNRSRKPTIFQGAIIGELT